MQAESCRRPLTESRWPKLWQSGFFVLRTKRNQTDLLTAQLDFEFVARLQLQGVGPIGTDIRELARVLLTASNTRRDGNTDRDFARDVFRFTGPSVLPILHEALRSEDRVIRAARVLPVASKLTTWSGTPPMPVCNTAPSSM